MLFINEILLSIIILPFVSSITVGLFGKYLGKFVSIIISVINIIITMLCCLLSFYYIGLKNNIIYLKLFSWIKINYININFALLFDSLTVTMLIIITIISCLVHIYSIEYMKEDINITRFLSYLSLFTFFMIILVTASNFLQMFFGWEGVGLSSYLLINFWYTRIQANKSAMKAMIMNKIGDISIIFVMLFCFYYLKTLEYAVIFNIIPLIKNIDILLFNTEFNIVNIICLFIFIGAVGKSAQLGLHTWLPDAMEGPTPVSALIHAATMVTAGVFLIIRCSPIFEYSPKILLIVLFVGGFTAFFAAMIGAFQNDLKKVIAYSTCSQLGYMVYACGLSNYYLSLFHLFNHAFFKALLFLSAGSIIHAMGDEQDMRKFGGLVKILPITYIMIFIASLALIGFPFLSGFYSKDIIIELAYSKYYASGRFIHWLGILTACCTAFYSIKSLYLTFITMSNSYKNIIKHVHEGSYLIIVPLLILCFFSIFVGFITKDLFIGLGSNFFKNAIFIQDKNLLILNSEFIPFYIKIIPLFFTILGLFIFIYFYINMNIIKDIIYIKIYSFFNKKWYVDLLYNFYIIRPSIFFGYKITYLLIDKGFIELLGPEGLSDFSFKLSLNLKKKQINTIQDQVFYLIFGIIFAITILMIYYFIL